MTKILTNAIGRELIVTLVAHPLVLGTAKHINHITDTETLSDPINTGERLLRLFGAIIMAGRIQAHIAVPARFALILAEIVE